MAATLAPLKVTDATVRFGGLVALDDVSIETRPAMVTGLIGPNGAGKTTLFNVVTGFIRPASGEVELNGESITRMRPDRRAKHGLGRTFQRLEVFSSLSVRENVLVALESRRRLLSFGWHPDFDVYELLERVGLTAVADVQTDRLSTGTIRLVEVARALAISPHVLLLDEPSAGLDRQERETLAKLLGELAVRDGISILLVEHDIEFIARVCSFVYVLDFGRLIAAGPPVEVRADRQVQEAYLGSPSSVSVLRARNSERGL